MCDFTTGFKFPEMVKERPVVVISEQLKDDLPVCRVIPLSTTRPPEVRAYHHKMEKASLPSSLEQEDEVWAKCVSIE